MWFLPTSPLAPPVLLTAVSSHTAPCSFRSLRFNALFLLSEIPDHTILPCLADPSHPWLLSLVIPFSRSLLWALVPTSTTTLITPETQSLCCNCFFFCSLPRLWVLVSSMVSYFSFLFWCSDHFFFQSDPFYIFYVFIFWIGNTSICLKFQKLQKAV